MDVVVFPPWLSFFRMLPQSRTAALDTLNDELVCGRYGHAKTLGDVLEARAIQSVHGDSRPHPMRHLRHNGHYPAQCVA